MEISTPVRARTRDELESVIMDYLGRLYLSIEDVEQFYIAEFELEQLDKGEVKTRTVSVEMCKFYFWKWADTGLLKGHAACTRGLRASVKCHIKREDCIYYQPSEHHAEG